MHIVNVRRAAVGLVGDGNNVCPLALEPLCIQRQALAGHAGDRSTRRIVRAAAACVGIPTVEGRVAGGGKGIDDGFQRVVILGKLLDHIAGAAVGLVDDGDVARGSLFGQLAVGVDRTTAVRQFDGAVRLHDGAFRNLDVLLLAVGIVRIAGIGTGHRASLAGGDLHVACGVVHIFKILAAIRLDDHIVLAADLIILTRQDYRTVCAFIDEDDDMRGITWRKGEARTTSESAAVQLVAGHTIAIVWVGSDGSPHVAGDRLLLVRSHLETAVFGLDRDNGLIGADVLLNRDVVVDHCNIARQSGQGECVGVLVPLGREGCFTAAGFAARKGDALEDVATHAGRRQCQRTGLDLRRSIPLDDLVGCAVRGRRVCAEFGLRRHLDKIVLVGELNALCLRSGPARNGEALRFFRAGNRHILTILQHSGSLGGEGFAHRGRRRVGEDRFAIFILKDDIDVTGGFLTIGKLNREIPGAFDLADDFRHIAHQRIAGKLRGCRYIGFTNAGCTSVDITFDLSPALRIFQHISNIAGIFGVVNLVGCTVRQHIGRHIQAAICLVKRSSAAVGHECITGRTQIQITLSGSICTRLVGTEYANDLAVLGTAFFDQLERNLAGIDIYEGNLVFADRKVRDLLDQITDKNFAVLRGSHNLNGLSGAIACDRFCRKGSRLTLHDHFDLDMRRVLRKVIGDNGVHIILHIICSDRCSGRDIALIHTSRLFVADVLILITKRNIVDQVRRIGDDLTVSFGDQLVVPVEQMTVSHKLHGMRDVELLLHNIILEADFGLTIIENIRCGQRLDDSLRALEGIALDARRIDGQRFASFYRVPF